VIIGRSSPHLVHSGLIWCENHFLAALLFANYCVKQRSKRFLGSAKNYLLLTKLIETTDLNIYSYLIYFFVSFAPRYTVYILV